LARAAKEAARTEATEEDDCPDEYRMSAAQQFNG